MTRTPSPSQAEPPDDSHAVFAALRDSLADLYADETSARVVVSDAGLDAKHIAFSTRAQSNWHNILTEAAHQRRLDELLSIVHAAYANNPRLKDAYAHYTLFVQQGGELTITTPLTEAPAPGEPPYKGLNFFEATDAHLYFGRQTLVNELVGMLMAISQGNHRFLAVIGASGSGKSSLVRAGLVSALKSGAIPGSDRWLIKIVTPTAQPVKELATVLTEREPDRATLDLIDDLAADDRVLDVRASKILMHDARTGSRLLLIVDQFEELFTLCKERTTRRAYIGNLLTAAQSDGPTIVILVLRADFYRYCLEYEQLRLLLEQHTKLVGPMNREQLREAIVGPAVANGWHFEEGLVKLFLDDVGDEPGALPLLAHALRETWERRRGRTLTLAGYSDVGRVQGAIGTTADHVFARLNDGQKVIAKNIFLRLTELGEGAEDTRRRARLSELLPAGQDQQSAEQVLQILADARLVTTHADEAEVAHEALIREWPQLRKWLDDDREGLRIHRRLTEAAKDWSTSRHDPSDLYRGSRLSQAQEWINTHATELNQLELDFLHASQADAEVQAHREVALAAERESNHLRELDNQRQLALEQKRRAHLFRNWSVVAAILLFWAIIAAGLSLYLNRELNDKNRKLSVVNNQLQTSLATTKRNAKIAFSRQLAVESTRELNNGNFEAAILLAVESGQVAETIESYNVIRDVLAYPWRCSTILYGHMWGITQATWNHDESKVLTSSHDNTARIWDIATGKELASFAGHQAVWSQDESKVLTINWDDNKVHIWDIATGKELASFAGHQAVWSQDESKVLTVSNHNTVHIWDVVTGKALVTFAGDQGLSPFQVTWSHDESKVLTVDNTARIWDAITGKELVKLTHIYRAVWSHDESKLLTMNWNDGAARILDGDTATEIVKLAGHTGGISQATWSQDESKVLTVNSNDTASIWDAITGKELVTFIGHTRDVVQAMWNHDESKVLTVSSDDTVSIWDAITGKELAKLAGHTGGITQAIWNQDASKVLTVSNDNTARIWDSAKIKELASFVGHTQGVVQATWNKDESKVLTVSNDTTARIWDMATGKGLIKLEKVYQAIWSQDASKVLTINWDGIVSIWEAATGKALVTFIGHTRDVVQAVWNHDESKVLTISDDDTARIWDMTTGKELVKLEVGEAGGVQAIWNKDESKVLTVNGEYMVRIWDVATAEELASFAGHQATWSQDGSKVLTVGDNNNAAIWSTITGKALVTFIGHEADLTQAIWSQDESKVLTSSNDNTARIWEAATGKALVTFIGHEAGVTQAVWSQDESKVLTVSWWDGTVRIWDSVTGKELAKLAGHNGGISQATWNQDESEVLTNSPDGTIRIWDVATAKELTIFEGYIGTWSQDENKVLFGGYDGTVYIWYTHMVDLLTAACKWVPRNLSWNEWQAYLRGEDRKGEYTLICPNAPVPPDAIDGILREARTQIQSGNILSGTQRLEQLNSWLKENGQFENYGVDVSTFIAEDITTATTETTSP